jgi:hypothetical protein
VCCECKKRVHLSVELDEHLCGGRLDPAWTARVCSKECSTDREICIPVCIKDSKTGTSKTEIVKLNKGDKYEKHHVMDISPPECCRDVWEQCLHITIDHRPACPVQCCDNCPKGCCDKDRCK